MQPAVIELATYMSELSEQAWCAGWMQDLEFALWRAVTETPYHYGRLDLTAEHVARLRALSEACGGWIVFREDEEFVPLAEWLPLYAAHHHAL